MKIEISPKFLSQSQCLEYEICYKYVTPSTSGDNQGVRNALFDKIIPTLSLFLLGKGDFFKKPADVEDKPLSESNHKQAQGPETTTLEHNFRFYGQLGYYDTTVTKKTFEETNSVLIKLVNSVELDNEDPKKCLHQIDEFLEKVNDALTEEERNRLLSNYTSYYLGKIQNETTKTKGLQNMYDGVDKDAIANLAKQLVELKENLLDNSIKKLPLNVTLAQLIENKKKCDALLKKFAIERKKAEFKLSEKAKEQREEEWEQMRKAAAMVTTLTKGFSS